MMHIERKHNVGKQAAIQKIDAFLDELARREFSGGFTVSEVSKDWTDNVMNLSFKVKKGFLGAKISGVIQVNEDSVTLDLELPALAAMVVSEDKVRETIGKALDPLFPS